MSGDGGRLRSTPTSKPTLRQRLSGRPSDEPPADSSTSLLISGAVAGGVSKFCTAPIDRVKLMYQVSTERQFTATAAARTVAKIVNTAGVSALWRGNSIAVVRDVPFGAILFSTYALAEESICGWRQRPPDARTRSAAGCAAGAIATFLTYPLDVLRARFGAEWAIQPRYSSYYQGVKEIMRNEGSAAFFAGLRPTLLGIMPYSALSFAAFETLKAAIVQWNLEQHARTDRELRVSQKLLAGGTAGLVAQTSTYPLHVVRRRMQAGKSEYRSTWHGLRSIYHTEGVVRGLYKGLTLTFIKGPLQSAIGFTTNDWVKGALRARERPRGTSEIDRLLVVAAPTQSDAHWTQPTQPRTGSVGKP